MTQETASDWDQFKVAVRTQVAGYYRTSRLWIILGIILAIGGGFTIAFLIKGTPWVHSALGGDAVGYVGALLSFISFLAIVTGAFFGGDAISTDFGTKSGYFMLALPVKRRVLLGGRYAAAFLVSLALMTLYFGFAVLGGAYFYSFASVPWFNVGIAYLLDAFLLLGILSFAFCLSAVSKSPAIGLVVTILVLLVVFNIVDGVIGTLVSNQYVLWSILFAAGAIPGVVRDGLATGSPAVWQSTIIIALYTIIFLAIALVLYDREET